MERIVKFFEENDKKHGAFDSIENKSSKRPDLHAFMLLDRLFPGVKDIISDTYHDEFWLSIQWDDILKISDDHLIELIRCGVIFDEENECFMMQV